GAERIGRDVARSSGGQSPRRRSRDALVDRGGCAMGRVDIRVRRALLALGIVFLFAKGADAADLTPPAVPLSLTARAANCGQIDLAWAAATDSGGSGLKGYNIYRNGTFVKQVTGLSTSDPGRAGSTLYGYSLSAVDNAGNESWRTGTATATTPACTTTDGTAPSVPGAPVVTAI